MTEILTESFCERCGTRYTFETVQQRGRPLKRVGTLGRGLKHFLVDPDSSIGEALAVARSEEEQRATTAQLEAFHRTFNFCLQCRQYTCGECWNAAEGRCLTCAPLPIEEVVLPAQAEGPVPAAAVLESVTLPLGAAGAPVSLPDFELPPLELPPLDLPTEAPAPTLEAEAEVEAEAEPLAEPEAEPTAELEAAPVAESEREPVPGAELERVLEVEAEPVAESEAAAEPVAEFEPEPLAEAVAEAHPEVEPEPVAEAVPEADPDVALEAEPQVEPEQVAELVPEPLVEAEPEPVAEAQPERGAEVAAEPLAEMEPEAEVEPEPAAAANPEPEPVAEAEPEPPAAANPEPESAPEPASPFPGFRPGRSLDDEIAAYELRVAALADLPPEAPTIPVTVARAPLTPPATRDDLAPAASTLEALVRPSFEPAPTPGPALATPPPTPMAATPGAAGPCRNCGLSISASARFCRRCGTRQDAA